VHRRGSVHGPPVGDIGLDAPVSPDGKELYFRIGSRDGGIWALVLSDRGRRKIVDGSFFAVSPALSADVLSAIAALSRPTDRR
jgi:hypothetical protein